MTDVLQIACPHCHALNRVPCERLGETPNCGRCHRPLFDGRPVVLDAASFEAHAARSDLPLLVDFWAVWCGPCKVMAPQFEQAARVLEPQVRLAKIDTEAAPGIASRFSIRSIPTLVLLHRGREVARQAGAMPMQSIVEFARRHVK